MKTLRPLLFLIVVAAVIGGLVFTYRQASREKENEAANEKPVTSEAAVKHGDTGEPVVTLNRETQKRMELVVAPVLATNVSEEFKGYGRVLSPAPVSDLLSEIEVAEAAAKNSRQEYERLKSLADNASIKSVQAAEAALRRDEVALQMSHNKLLANWGQAIAERKDLAEFAHSLLLAKTVLVRVDLPIGEAFRGTPTIARIAPLASDNFVEAHFVERAPNIESSLQGQSFLFVADVNKSGLAPGASVTALIPFMEKSVEGVLISRDAILRHQGSTFVYVQTGDTTFTRRDVRLRESTDGGWVVSGIDASARVVISGAHALLSEEMKSQIELPD